MISARELNAGETAELKRVLKETRPRTAPETSVDPALLGGLKVKVGSHDRSILRTKLDSLRAAMKGSS